MADIARIHEALRMLGQIIPEERIISDREALAPFSRDETPDLSQFPDVLVFPLTTQEVSNIAKICSTLHIPLIPRGKGTGVAGGAIAIHGGVMVSFERMNRIIEIDRENLVAVVEPGVITRDIDDAAKEAGLMYPPDPSSLDSCSIGGNVAVGAGGPRAVKYGTTRDYVIGLECVLADGSIMMLGGKYVKNATGYNLIPLLVGSEGTLALITKIYLRLIPRPNCTIDILIPFDEIGRALESVEIITAAKITPTAIEFMEEDALRLVSAYLKTAMPFPLANAHLLIELDGHTEEEVYRQAQEIVSLLRFDENRVIVASTPQEREKIWRARRSIREAIRRVSPVFLAEDTVVPRASIHRYLIALKKEFSARGLQSLMFGHAGDGNVHVDILKGDMPIDDWRAMLDDLKSAIYQIAVSLGGTISGEHGIGYIKKEHLPLAMDDATRALMQNIKRVFDPQGILNPGKIVE
jgi:glycolate oxidase